MAALGIEGLDAYVKAEDHLKFQKLAEGTVSVNVTHSNLNQQWPELRFDLHMTVGALKDRLYRHGGTGAGYQRLLLKTSTGELLCELSDDTKMLGFYGVQSGMGVHVVDTDPYSYSKDGGLEDLTKVKKYVMSDEEYRKRPECLAAYKAKKREKDPYWTFLPENRREPKDKEALDESSVKGMAVGQRCEVQPGGRRGAVAWIGQDENLMAGYWVGVKFDEPVGKSNGSIKGSQKFDCPPRYGGFVRPSKVAVGDYPEVDIFDESSDEEEL